MVRWDPVAHGAPGCDIAFSSCVGAGAAAMLVHRYHLLLPSAAVRWLD